MELEYPVEALMDTLTQASATSAHPALHRLLRWGLFPGFRRYRRNWSALYAFHCGAPCLVVHATTPSAPVTLSPCAYSIKRLRRRASAAHSPVLAHVLAPQALAKGDERMPNPRREN